jgi:predicted DNA-binding protein YlxM (UPF0122 family)
MEKIYEIGMLLDFYGSLLTKSQYECLDLQCNQDLSLAEIAEHLSITRQGVFDFIKKGRNLLTEYELKLGLLERFMDTKQRLEEVQDYLMVIDQDKLESDDKYMIHKAIKNLNEIINKL